MLSYRHPLSAMCPDAPGRIDVPISLIQSLAVQSGLADSGAMTEDVYTHLLQLAELSLPIALCEPVTDMQRRGDFLEYVELLHEVSPN